MDIDFQTCSKPLFYCAYIWWPKRKIHVFSTFKQWELPAFQTNNYSNRLSKDLLEEETVLRRYSKQTWFSVTFIFLREITGQNYSSQLILSSIPFNVFSVLVEDLSRGTSPKSAPEVSEVLEVCTSRDLYWNNSFSFIEIDRCPCAMDIYFVSLVFNI